MVGGPGVTNSGGETSSIANISSVTLLDIGIGGEPSGIDLCRATPERSLIGWVRGPDWGMSCKLSQSPYFSIARSTKNDDRVIGALFDCSIRTAFEILFKRSYGSTPSMR